jgi:hypothetical protein
MEPKATSIVWIWGVLSFGPESPRIGLWAEAPFDNDKPSESKNMKNSPDLKSMSVDELWSLHGVGFRDIGSQNTSRNSKA